MQFKSLTLTSIASNSDCLLASLLTVAVPSVYLDFSWGQWGPLTLGALKIENEKVVLMIC